MYSKNDDQSNDFTIPDHVLSDLCSRFIINVPEEDRNDLIRVFFQIEIAHWFYLDFYCDDSNFSPSSSSGSGSGSSSSSSSASQSSSDDDTDDACNLISRKYPLLKPCSIRQFAALIFRYCPYLMPHSNNVDDILSNWRLFKHAVPTNGAIIIDPSRKHVLLVQGFWAKASWGFPKGKVNENESEAACARREVLEETGYDIEAGMQEDQYLQIQMQEQIIRLYIIDGVSMKTKFEPRTRKEIKEVRWFPIDDLPVHRKDHRTKHRLGYSPNSFFMVIPFVKSLKQWIAIQNGSLPSAQLINGGIVHAKTPNMNSSHKHSNKKITRSNGNQSSGGTKSTSRRRNSHSHSGGNQHHHQHHHQTHSLAHYQNDSPAVNRGIGQANKSLSQSNENLSNNTPSGSSKKPQNVFLKHFSNGFGIETSMDPVDARAQSIKNQTQHYQKIQQTELADLLSLKDAVSGPFKSNKPVQQLGGHNSKFKPVITSNNNAGKTKPSQNLSNVNQKRPLSSMCKELQFSPLTPAKSFTIESHSTQLMSKSTSLNEHGVKKHLDFGGPECWVNFKFDYDSLSQCLPPPLIQL